MLFREASSSVYERGQQIMKRVELTAVKQKYQETLENLVMTCDLPRSFLD